MDDADGESVARFCENTHLNVDYSNATLRYTTGTQCMHTQRHSTTALLNMRHAATRMPVRIDTHFARPRSSCERVDSPLAPLGAINLAGIPTAVYPSGTWLGLG